MWIKFLYSHIFINHFSINTFFQINELQGLHVAISKIIVAFRQNPRVCIKGIYRCISHLKSILITKKNWVLYSKSARHPVSSSGTDLDSPLISAVRRRIASNHDNRIVKSLFPLHLKLRENKSNGVYFSFEFDKIHIDYDSNFTNYAILWSRFIIFRFLNFFFLILELVVLYIGFICVKFNWEFTNFYL